MTNPQKERIAHLRGRGESYSKIAAALRLSENTVKSFCRRNKLGADIAAGHTADTKNNGLCGSCGGPLIHTPGAKKRRFCSDGCRMAWWNTHPEAVNRKAVYRFVCPACGTDFESYGNARRKYCSRACFGAARRVCHDQG